MRIHLDHTSLLFFIQNIVKMVLNIAFIHMFTECRENKVLTDDTNLVIFQI